MKSNPSISRRQFVAGSAASAVAISSLGTSLVRADETESAKESAKATPKPYKKAVKIGMVRVEGSLTDKFRVLKELGFDGVELNSPGGPSADEVKRAKDETGLQVPGLVDSVHWRDRLSDPDPAVRKKGLDALKTAIRSAKDYGATSVLLVPGRVDQGATYEQAWERSISETKKALPLAEDLGIHVLIENVWNDFLTKPKEMARYIDELDSKMAGAYYDVGNSVRYAPTVEWVKTLGKRIVKLDIKDFDLEQAKKNGWGSGFKVKLLEGAANWPGVMAELRKLKYEGWGTAEIAGGGPERLKEIAWRMNKIFAS